MEARTFQQACVDKSTAQHADSERVFGRFVAEYAESLRAHAARLLGHAADAPDVVQAVLLKAWKYCHSFDGSSQLSTWLYPILRRTVLDHVEQAPPRAADWRHDDGRLRADVETALREQADAGGFEPDARLSRAQGLSLFEQAFAAFEAAHPKEAAVLRMVAIDDLSMAELAQALGRSLGATREHVSQCRKKARPFLQGWFEFETAPALPPRRRAA